MTNVEIDIQAVGNQILNKEFVDPYPEISLEKKREVLNQILNKGEVQEVWEDYWDNCPPWKRDYIIDKHGHPDTWGPQSQEEADRTTILYFALYASSSMIHKSEKLDKSTPNNSR